MVVLWIVLGVVVLLLLYWLLERNSMVGARNRVDEAWSGIDVQLKRRHDLIPNLVEAVKGYAEHERGTFEAVTQARADAMKAQGPAEASRAEGRLNAVLGDLRAVAENYPQLRATENFQQLTNNLSELEDEIQASRRIYNSNVQSYNTKIQVFPNSVIAGIGNFEAREFFEITEPTDREVPQVSFTGSPPAAPAAPPAAAPEAPPAPETPAS